MAIDDNSIDECGIRKDIQPPPYKNSLGREVNSVAQTGNIFRGQERHATNVGTVTYFPNINNTQTSFNEPDFDEEFTELTKNTRKSAESLEEIRSLMMHQESCCGFILSLCVTVAILYFFYLWLAFMDPYTSDVDYQNANST